MPKKVVENTKTLSLPKLPPLTGSKNSRVITKHFTNMALYMPYEQYALMSWLIFQVSADNSFEYGEKIVEKYVLSVKAAVEEYNSVGKIRVDYKVIRTLFKELIEKGYLLPTVEQSVFIINPMLSYRPNYVSRQEYELFCDSYEIASKWTFDCKIQTVASLVTFNSFVNISDYYRRIVNEKIKKKSK